MGISSRKHIAKLFSESYNNVSQGVVLVLTFLQAHLGAKDCTPESNTSEIVGDFQWHFQWMFSGIFQRIDTFPVDCSNRNVQ